MGVPFNVTFPFPLAAVKILSLYLTFDNLILMCLSVALLGSFGPYGSGCPFLSPGSGCVAIIALNIFSVPFSFSYPSGIPIM